MNDNRTGREFPSTSPRWSWPTVAWTVVAVGAWIGAQWQFTRLGDGAVHVVASAILVVLSLVAAATAVRRRQRSGVVAGGAAAPRAEGTARHGWRPPSTFSRRPQPAWFWLVLAVTSVLTAVARAWQGSSPAGVTVLLVVVAAAAAVLGVRRLRRP